MLNLKQLLHNSLKLSLITTVVLGGAMMISKRPITNAAPPNHFVEITVRDGYRYITSNGIPNHATGRFPNHGNPNSIQEQRHTFRVPLQPKIAGRQTDAHRQPFGVALNGVPFDPGTAEFWRNDPNWRYEALSGIINLGLDDNNAHVQPSGAYHYHGLPMGLLRQFPTEKKITLVGYAADGFPMYAQYGLTEPMNTTSAIRELRSSYRLKSGVRPNGPGGKYDGAFVQDWEYVTGSGDLDECNGRFGVTPEYPSGVYYYCLTKDYPFIPRHYRGTPDDSFRRHDGGGGPPGRPPFGFPPRPRP
jgi:YHYH protein